jgi:hypothetical protein
MVAVAVHTLLLVKPSLGKVTQFVLLVFLTLAERSSLPGTSSSRRLRPACQTLKSYLSTAKCDQITLQEVMDLVTLCCAT